MYITGWTHAASLFEYRHADVMKQLLAARCNVHLQDQDGHTALKLAQLEGYHAVRWPCCYGICCYGSSMAIAKSCYGSSMAI